jgi:hypothetical protein
MSNIQAVSIQQKPFLTKAPSTTKKGDLVKIIRYGERFWCLVKSISKQGTIYATVANDLLYTRKKYGDPIRFNTSEVIDYQKKKR